MKDQSYRAKLLIANPLAQFNALYHRSVVLVTSHSIHGAVGLIVNLPRFGMDYHKMSSMLGRKIQSTVEFRSSSTSKDGRLVFTGGPMAPLQPYFLYQGIQPIGDSQIIAINLLLSNDPNFAVDYFAGFGPKKTKILLGHVSWGPGQLEQELSQDHWIISNYNESLVFTSDYSNQWQQACEYVGFNFKGMTGKQAEC